MSLPEKISLNCAPFFAIAGLWKEGKGDSPAAFAMLTIAPGPDVKPYHSRQVVVLRPEDWAAWIYLTKAESELLRPLPDGSLDRTCRNRIEFSNVALSAMSIGSFLKGIWFHQNR